MARGIARHSLLSKKEGPDDCAHSETTRRGVAEAPSPPSMATGDGVWTSIPSPAGGRAHRVHSPAIGLGRTSRRHGMGARPRDRYGRRSRPKWPKYGDALGLSTRVG